MKKLLFALLIGLVACKTQYRTQYKVTPYGIIETGKVKKGTPTKDILSNGDTIYRSETQLFIIKKGGKDTTFFIQ